MTVSQIKWFLTVARTLNFTKAADQLEITQPTLSRQIVNMETELNVQLFIRDGRSVSLTPAGRELARSLGKVYAEYQESVSQARQIQRGISGDLRIGILDGTYVSDFMPPIVDYFSRNHPYVELIFENATFKELEDRLYNDTLDIVFTVAFSIEANEYLVSKKVEHSYDHIVMNRHHPLAARKALTLADCREETFILISTEDCPESSNLIIEACKKHGFYPNIKWAPSLYDMMLNTETGKGITILDTRNILLFNPNILSFRQERMGWDPSLTAVWNRSNYNPAIPVFMKQLDRMIRKLELKNR